MKSLTSIGNASKGNYFNGIVIRKVTNKKQLKGSQFDEVVELVMGNVKHHAGLDDDAGWNSIKTSDMEKYITDVLENRNEFIIIAVDDERIAGIIVGGHYRRYNRKHVSIYDLFVGEDYRRAGLGKGLLDKVTNEKIEGKPLVVELTVYDNNPNAVNLYRKWGMQSKTIQMRRVI